MNKAVWVPFDDRPPSRRAHWSRIITVSVVTLTLAAGCGDIDSTGQDITRGDLVTDLAGQLSRSSALTYSADYRLSGGATATIVQAQQPQRSAYLYPGGKVTVTADATTECRTAAKNLTCTMTAPPTPTSRPPATLFDSAGRQGMVTPTTVLGLLNATALDGDAEITQHDTTIAGRHATCVEVRDVDNAAASAYDACITNEGVLGTFAATIGDDAVDVAMTRYVEAVDGNIFDPPPAAKVIDRRN
jgi:hypothetical protein